MTTLFAPNTLPGERTDRAHDDRHRYIGLGARRIFKLSCRSHASAARRFTARSEQGAAALRAVALPAGTTVWQGHLPRVGDRHLLAADAPGVRAGVLCLGGLRAPLNHARQAYSRQGAFMHGAARTSRRSVGGDMIRLASSTPTSISGTGRASGSTMLVTSGCSSGLPTRPATAAASRSHP